MEGTIRRRVASACARACHACKPTAYPTPAVRQRKMRWSSCSPPAGRRVPEFAMTSKRSARPGYAFLLSANLGEIVLFTIAILGGLGVPMTVVQVLTVNLGAARTHDPCVGAVILALQRRDLLVAP
jgi:hypothetical protein